jgi:hypothetical protein
MIAGERPSKAVLCWGVKQYANNGTLPSLAANGLTLFWLHFFASIKYSMELVLEDQELVVIKLFY